MISPIPLTLPPSIAWMARPNARLPARADTDGNNARLNDKVGQGFSRVGKFVIHQLLLFLSGVNAFAAEMRLRFEGQKKSMGASGFIPSGG